MFDPKPFVYIKGHPPHLLSVELDGISIPLQSKVLSDKEHYPGFQSFCLIPWACRFLGKSCQTH